MKESVYQAKILLALRVHPALRDAIIWKFTDRLTGGIPDFCVIWKGRTTWWEVKVAPRKVTKLQAYYIYKIGKSANVIMHYQGSNFIASGGEDSLPFTIDELIEVIVRRITQ